RPDLERLAVVGSDGQVRLWDLTSGQLLSAVKDPTQHPDATTDLRGLAFCPEGLRLLSTHRPEKDAGALSEISVWDGATGKALATVKAHPKGVKSLVLSPDGHLLAVNGLDGFLSLWDLGSRQVLQSWPNDPRTSIQPGFSPDSKQLAT